MTKLLYQEIRERTAFKKQGKLLPYCIFQSNFQLKCATKHGRINWPITKKSGILMNIFKGTIITCDGNDTVCEYLVEENGRITYAGNELPEKL